VIFLAIFGCKIVNWDEMDGDRLRLPANRNCYRLSRVSWTLAKISCQNLTSIRFCSVLRKPKNRNFQRVPHTPTGAWLD